VILAARSEYFEALLYNGSEESNQSELTFNDISPNAFRMLLKYIYTGSVTMVPSNIDLTLEMMGLAHQYSFPDVESAIIKKLKTMLNLTNICSILYMANVYNLNELREVCHVFMDKHALEILKCDCFNELTQVSMIKLLQRDTFFAPEGEIFKSVAKWCKVNNDVDDLVVKSVRLSWLTVVEIVSIVWPSKLLHNEILLNAIAEIQEDPIAEPNCVRNRIRVMKIN
ncbi:BTB and/or BACK domain containing protein, partial [Asbolus verrucosus]